MLMMLILIVDDDFASFCLDENVDENRGIPQGSKIVPLACIISAFIFAK